MHCIDTAIIGHVHARRGSVADGEGAGGRWTTRWLVRGSSVAAAAAAMLSLAVGACWRHALFCFVRTVKHSRGATSRYGTVAAWRVITSIIIC